MNENQLILLEWGKSIENLPKLDFNSARNLYVLYLNEKDLTKKQQIREELITGSLHVVYSYLIKNHFDILKSSFYDMNDIINSSVEYLINAIDNGGLLKYNKFHYLFNTSTFYSYLTDSLIGQRCSISEETTLNATDFVKLLIEMRNIFYQDDHFSYNEFIKLMKSDKFNINYKKWYNAEYMIAYIILKKIVTEENLDDLSETKIEMFKYLLINSALERIVKEQPEALENMEDKILQDIVNREFLDIIFDLDCLSDYDIIAQRYGVNGYSYPRTIKQVAKNKGLTCERIRQKEAKMLRKIRYNQKVREYIRGVYDEI